MKPVAQRRARRKRYDIWSTRAQEDVLLENMINCDVSNIDRSRSVETYPTLNNRRTNKRTCRDRVDDNIRLYKPERQEEEVKGASRFIADLGVNAENDDAEIAKDMANKLYEEKEELICKLILFYYTY